MPADTRSQLRVVCICGQRMKISADMFGLPGKCVSCRQKITIPRHEDIPEGSEDFVLDEHPEYLRGPRVGDKFRDEERAAQAVLDQVTTPPPEDEESTPITELDLPEDEAAKDDDSAEADEPPPSPVRKAKSKPARRAGRENGGASTPLDPLEPLRVVLSLRIKIADQRRQLEDMKSADRNLLAELDGHASRIKRVLQDFHEKLRQLLMESVIELTGVQEKLTQAQVDARVSSMSIGEYQETVHRLRARRDRLEHRQANLRAWIALRDPFLAGGYLDLTMDALPQDGFALNIPAESEEDGTLLNKHTEMLRAAMELRATAEKNIETARRIRNPLQGKERDAANRAVADAKALKRRAHARIVFFQERIKLLERDFQSDLDVVAAQMESARDRMRINEIDRTAFDRIEAALTQAKTDLTKARALARRSLVANSSTDVPQPRGTFLERLGWKASNAEPATPLEWGLAGTGAFLLLLTLILPTVGRHSLIATMSEYAGEGAALFLLPLASALLVVGALYIPNRRMRGIAWLVLATLGGFLTVMLVYRGLTVTSPLAAAFRSGAAGWLQPGLIATALGGLIVFAAATVGLYTRPDQRYWPLGGLALVVIAAIVAGASSAASATAEPVLGVQLGALLEDQGVTAADITIINEGDGELRLTAQPSGARNTYQLTLQRRTASGWESVPTPALAAGPGGLLYSIPGKSRQTVQVLVEPGSYRVSVASAADQKSLVSDFVVRPPEPENAREIIALQPPAPRKSDPTPEPAPPAIGPDDPAEDMEDAPVSTVPPDPAPEPQVEPIEDTVYVELKGILFSVDGDPRFSLLLHIPERDDQRINMGIGEAVYGDWIIQEFNSQHRSVTLANGDELLTVRRGERQTIPGGG